MANNTKKNRAIILDNVFKHISRKLPAAKIDMLKTFISQYFEHISIEDLQERNAADLYGAALSHWNFLYNRKPGETKLRIFNPDYEGEGWTSNHTIIELIQDDMPFLVDSLRMEISRLGYGIHLIINIGGMRFKRNNEGNVTHILATNDNDPKAIREAPIHIEIDKHTSPETLMELEAALLKVLGDVQLCVEDWQHMRKQLFDCIEELEVNKNLPDQDGGALETIEFLRWMVDDHFTFLGCRDYTLLCENDDLALEIVPDSGYGVLRDKDHSKKRRNFSEMPPAVRELATSKQILLIAKSNTISTVHRPAYTDYISIKRFNEKGDIIGERRFVGLFTSLAYNSNPEHIPFLRNKARQILERSNLASSGHAYKELRNIIEIFPRDDLFQAGVDELYELCTGILRMQERPQIRFFARRDLYGRFMSCLVYVPSDQYSVELRRKMLKVLKDAFSSDEVSFTTLFSESLLARIHFMIRINPHENMDYNLKRIEKRLIDAGRSWNNDLRICMLDFCGEEKGNELAMAYEDAFPAGYRETFSPRTAVYDVQYMERLNGLETLEMSLYQPLEDSDTMLRLKLYRHQQTAPLSDVLPILENMGMRVIGEDPYEIIRKDGELFWINNFSMTHENNIHLNVHQVREVFQEAFTSVWFGRSGNDRFNYLVLSAALTWRETGLLRAYAKYLIQTGFTYSQTYIEDTFCKYPEISKALIEFYNLTFDPRKQDTPGAKIKQLEQQLLNLFEQVESLDEDKILRRYYEVFKATIRTNFYQTNKDGLYKSYISFKFRSKLVPDLPKPLPEYEIFVYSPDFEGIHLRAGKVARGGLRWSDRREDFRTEVLGLMKAQQVKNALIVPHGAKGGFVVKELPPNGTRDDIMEKVVDCYKNFIRGLLDITDNMVDGECVYPKNVVRYDGDDPYLVVAADKGTATFSDIANCIAAGEYDFWLGDAFASGGSAGYDHKKMGITARGAWESVKRHFRTLEIDCQTTDFTTVGVGDMAGDVFGNGMLLSKHTRLLAAFNHIEIFVDPNPDADISFKERKRLFDNRLGWGDYDEQLISKGGGVFRRSAKAIRLTPEIKQTFFIDKDIVEPNELIKAILRARVDLLWNGGIGTFVKSTNELHADAGDRTNDGIRINADELNCRIVGEGGNLGLTQLARVEYALGGGLIFTDFIDNSAGVDCSDCEVNIKILLNEIVAKGDLTSKQRNELLAKMTNEVAHLVLEDNYHQAQAINVSMHSPKMTIDLYRRYIEQQERDGKLDRELEFLPNKAELTARKQVGKGFTRPELCVLLSYSKNILKEKILNSDVVNDDEFADVLLHAFPETLQEKYGKIIKNHRLKSLIVATKISNQIVNTMGVAFIHRLQNETGASVELIVRAYMIARRVFDATGIWRSIEQLDGIISPKLQVNLLLEAFRLLQRATRWFLRNRRRRMNISENVDYFLSGMTKLTEFLPTILLGTEKEDMDSAYRRYSKEGVPDKLAHLMASSNALFSALDIIEAASENDLQLKELASIYFALGDKLDLSWLRHQVRYHTIETHWDGMARSALRDDLDRQQRDLSVSILYASAPGKSVEERVSDWLNEHSELVKRWKSILVDIRTGQSSFTIFLVAVRELMDLTQNTLITTAQLKSTNEIKKTNVKKIDVA